MKALKATLLVFVCLFFANGLFAQKTEDPTTWTTEVKKIKDKDYKVIFHMKLKEGWHIWSLKPAGDGMQLPPEFTFDKNPDVKLKGGVVESGKKITGKMDGVEGDGIVNYFKGKVDYTQQVAISANTMLSGSYTYQVCDDNMCLPPKSVTFTVEIKDAGTGTGAITRTDSAKITETPPAKIDSSAGTGSSQNAGAQNDTAKSKTAATTPGSPGKTPGKGNGADDIEKIPLWTLFLLSLVGGLVSVFTPCIFSMIPITISFFTKRSKSRAEGIKNAIYYSISIIFIFTILGVLISAIFGAAALNTLSTDWRANLFFFVLIVIFAISFLGAFEISLPSSWTNVTDSRAGVGSFMGIFFMALTLAIVSFSCTGPIVGPLLVYAGKGGIAGPAVGMFGFSLGLALPFSLFAIFPGMINKLAQSGGWLNQVKVVLGFIELMLALKFLSNADLAMQWRLLDREIFIAIWIVLAILLGVYLLGKLKLSHDDAPAKNIYGQEYVSIFKLFLAIVSFTFAVYLVPGMWGAPLNGMSAFLPPMGTFAPFGGKAVEGNSAVMPVKYVKEFDIYAPPVVKDNGLVVFFDYDEAIAASKIMKKPVMLDFTGINCVNCRKMESQVWSLPAVAKKLKEDFIIVSLYCDANKFKLPKEKQYYSKDLGQNVTTIGNKNSDLQASKFGSNGMPIYYFVDDNGNKLTDKAYSYDPDEQKFLAHLDLVKSNYKRAHIND